MTAQEQMRKMLDELMGTKRDGEDIEEGLKFTDPSVCKSFLMGLCPFEQFHNTKLDLGPCHKYHSLALKADYEQAAQKKDYGYDVDQLEHLTSFVGDCDRKVEVNKKRLEDNSEDYDASPEAMAVHTLNEQIGKFLAESETLGADGKVEESFTLMKEVEELKSQKRKAEDIYRNSLPVTTSQQQKLRVCEICGAYLSLYDNDRRLADHFGGKLHMGFIKIRERLADLKESVVAKREAREKEREERRKEREEKQAREREERNRNRDKDTKDKDRDRDRDRRRRTRSRSRERSHRRDRSREKRSDRSRSRNRDRSRDRYRHRSNRDRSRDRRSPDRSRDRRRDRSRERRRRSRDRNSRERSRRRSRDRHGSKRGSRDRSKERRERSRDRSKERRDRSRDRSKGRSRDRSRERSRNRSKENDISVNEGNNGEINTPVKEDGEVLENTNEVNVMNDKEEIVYEDENIENNIESSVPDVVENADENAVENAGENAVEEAAEDAMM